MVESWASSPGSRASMRANRRRDTKPELAVRKLVHATGLRYRVDFAPLHTHRRHRADLVFTRAKVAVFIDGCYWHGCPEHHRQPSANADYWAAKVAGNRDRDAQVSARLVDEGWTVLRFWEHENPTDVAAQVVEVVRG
ncbi:very short patch repair endonuclease [Rhodococcus marinonascens]|uniref:very short patch repair endonuclease n=1 Tax=Rhodococcus marinonascens TaxID=38311 RepID=UPI0009321B77|nr:very short patch repair endonuclease [Rhodococcus marinonascens]